MINIGVIGCGYWGPNLIRNFNQIKESNMMYCADLSKERLDHMKELYPDIKITDNYKDIIENQDIDAVAIATPVFTHFKFAKEALANDKHVLIEKPFTSSSKEAKELIELAKKKGKIIMVDHTFEYTSPVEKIKELIDNDDMGKVYTVSMARVNLGLFQQDINVIWDLAPHDISILNFILESKPVKVKAVGKAFVQPKIEDTAFISLLYPNGTLAQIHVSWLDPCKIRRTSIVGSKKMLVYDDIETTEKIKIYDKGVSVETIDNAKQDHYDSFGEFQYLYRSGDIYIPKLNMKEPLNIMCRHFLDCIENNKTPKSDGNSGLRVVEVIEAAQESLKNNSKWVDLDG